MRGNCDVSYLHFPFFLIKLMKLQERCIQSGLIEHVCFEIFQRSELRKSVSSYLQRGSRLKSQLFVDRMVVRGMAILS
jgi:hypothetical protein